MKKGTFVFLIFSVHAFLSFAITTVANAAPGQFGFDCGVGGESTWWNSCNGRWEKANFGETQTPVYVEEKKANKVEWQVVVRKIPLNDPIRVTVTAPFKGEGKDIGRVRVTDAISGELLEKETTITIVRDYPYENLIKSVKSVWAGTVNQFPKGDCKEGNWGYLRMHCASKDY